jgi:molecular chaperone GrpE
MTSRGEHDLSAPGGEVDAIGEAVEGTEERGPGSDGAGSLLDEGSGQTREPEHPETSEEAGSASAEVDQVAQASEAILTDVAALTAERDEYLAALQRSQADFANYRKRVLRQQEELGARAVSDLVRKLLPVLDTLDLALAHLATARDDRCTQDSAEAGAAPERQVAEVDALQQARSQLLDTLVKEGLERVDAVGVVFDPAIHEAVAHVDSEGAPPGDEHGPTVAEVMRPGYRWRGQTLRAAMVRVRG